MIESRGNAFRFRCSNIDCENGCKKTLASTDVGWENLLKKRHGVKNSYYLQIPPQCPLCKSIVLPSVLLRDEDIKQHDLYQSSATREWMEEASCLIIIGFSDISDISLLELQKKKRKYARVYVFSTQLEPHSDVLEVKNILGWPEESLLLLAHTIDKTMKLRCIKKSLVPVSSDISSNLIMDYNTFPARMESTFLRAENGGVVPNLLAPVSSIDYLSVLTLEQSSVAALASLGTPNIMQVI